MNLYFHIGVLAAAAAWMLLASRLLRFRKHALFYFILAQIVVYCFAAPTINVYLQVLDGTELDGWYLYLQCICLGVFIPSFVFAYVGSARIRSASCAYSCFLRSSTRTACFAA